MAVGVPAARTRPIPGPHSDPHGPIGWTPPPDACDTHCHIFEPADRFPLAGSRSCTPPDSGIDKFEALQERLGLSRAILMQASCHDTDNSSMLDAIRRGVGRYGGVAMIDDHTTDAEMSNLHEAGVRGIRFNFATHFGDAPALDTYWRRVNRVALSVGAEFNAPHSAHA